MQHSHPTFHAASAHGVPHTRHATPSHVTSRRATLTSAAAASPPLGQTAPPRGLGPPSTSSPPSSWAARMHTCRQAWSGVTDTHRRGRQPAGCAVTERLWGRRRHSTTASRHAGRMGLPLKQWPTCVAMAWPEGTRCSVIVILCAHKALPGSQLRPRGARQHACSCCATVGSQAMLVARPLGKEPCAQARPGQAWLRTRAAWLKAAEAFKRHHINQWHFCPPEASARHGLECPPRYPPHPQTAWHLACLRKLAVLRPSSLHQQLVPQEQQA